MAEKKVKWFINFECDCKTEYSFEVTEWEVLAGGTPGASGTGKRKPRFTNEREYLYYCLKDGKNKVALYTDADITDVEVPDDNQTGWWSWLKKILWGGE